MGFLDYGPLTSKVFQFVSWEVCLSFGQALAGTRDHGVCPVIIGLTEDSTQDWSHRHLCAA